MFPSLWLQAPRNGAISFLSADPTTAYNNCKAVGAATDCAATVGSSVDVQTGAPTPLMATDIYCCPKEAAAAVTGTG